MRDVPTFTIIVSYYPQLKIFNKLLESLLYQVKRIYIIDNTNNQIKFFKKPYHEKIKTFYFNKNTGIAYAQNVGINKAIEEGAEYIILSDQDTIYPENYVSEMLKCFEDEKVAAAGPMFVDTHTGNRQFFIVADKFRFKKIYPKSGKYEVLQLIASGTMIKVSALKEIGFMREEFFIDWVDMEWCWRAIKKGYKLIGNADVIVYHQHGENSVSFLGKEITIRKSWRYYYTIRNGIYLSVYSDLLSPYLRTLLFIKTLRNTFLYPFLTNPRLESLKYSMLGLYHGLIGKLGKLNDGSH